MRNRLILEHDPVTLSATEYRQRLGGTATLGRAERGQHEVPAVRLWYSLAYKLAVLTLVALAVNSATADEIIAYSSDFEDGVGAEWSTTKTGVTPVGARRFLGEFRNTSVQLSLGDLPRHSSLELSFDLYALGSWDGSSSSTGPDIFVVAVDGGPVLLSSTFSNVPGLAQSYPNPYPGPSVGPRSGAIENNTLGCGYYWGDAVYHMALSFAHPVDMNTLAISFSGNLNNIGYPDEAWGLDNVRVTAAYDFQPERFYAGPFSGNWNSSHWTDLLDAPYAGAPAPTPSNPVFINKSSVMVSSPNAGAQSVLVNGGKLVVDGAAGGSLQVAQHLELGNSLHVIPGDPTHTGTGQGWMQQKDGSNVTVAGDLILGGKDSVYEIGDTSRLNVAGDVLLLTDANALFHQRGGTVIIGSAFDENGHSTNGLLDLGRGTTYEMDGGVLDVATIQQTGLFVFKGGQLHVKQMLINAAPTEPTPTYTPAPAPIYSPATPAAAAGGGGGDGGGGCHMTSSGGFSLERGIVVLDQYSDWRLEGENADLTVGANSADGSNGNLVQSGGNVNVDGSLVIGSGPGGKGSYAMSDGSLVVHGQMVLGRNGGIGHFDQTGGAVTVDGQIVITESDSGLSRFNIEGGTLQADALSIGAGELHVGADAYVRILDDVFIGEHGKVTGSGTFDIEGADVVNNGLIEPGNSPGRLAFDSAYTQGSTGILHMEFAGDEEAGSDYDTLLIGGDVCLAGTLVLDFIEGYAPKAGDEYDLVAIYSGGGLLSDLASLTVDVVGLRPGWEYELVYDGADTAICLRSLTDGVSTVPEPATLSFLSLAAGSLLRRRK